VQCLDDQGIPLYLSHTVVCIKGDERVEGVTVAKVDENLKPIPGTEWDIECDTLLLSIGLIPENELSLEAGVELDATTGGPIVTDEMETSIPGIFACGNVVHIHDLVDNVTREARAAGEGAARLVTGQQPEGATIQTRAGDGVRYVVPQQVHVENLADRDVRLFMRVTRPAENVRVEAVIGEEVVFSKFERIVRPAEMVALTIPAGRISGKAMEATGAPVCKVVADGADRRGEANPQVGSELVIRIAPLDASRKGGKEA
ncbi:MAG: FAD-dependent oxidoreductase, partial [Firmicutes bacterium]|nr:FAD-dependent oxidoreductase [Bacillota bacterium]